MLDGSGDTVMTPTNSMPSSRLCHKTVIECGGKAKRTQGIESKEKNHEEVCPTLFLIHTVP